MLKITRNMSKGQRGHFWATVTLLLCGAFSVYANVRAGQLNRDGVIVSLAPPIVAFLSAHLLTYFNPRSVWSKALLYGGFGLILVCAMAGSGQHIYEFTHKNGQTWEVSLMYILMTDAPMLLAAAALIEKVPTTKSVTTQAKADTVTPTPTKRATPAKKTVPAKATKPTQSPQTAQA